MLATIKRFIMADPTNDNGTPTPTQAIPVQATPVQATPVPAQPWSGQVAGERYCGPCGGMVNGNGCERENCPVKR